MYWIQKQIIVALDEVGDSVIQMKTRHYWRQNEDTCWIPDADALLFFLSSHLFLSLT